MGKGINRRQFVGALGGGAAWLGFGRVPTHGLVASGSARTAADSTVGLVKGTDRRENIVRALEPFASQLKEEIGSRQVVIKPNLTRVKREDQLASSHVDGIRGICDVLSSVYDGKIIVAEGTGPGLPLEEALQSYDYYALQKEYPVEFVDLQKDQYFTAHILDAAVSPVPLRISKLLTAPSTYLISAAVMKTHSLSAITLGLKNIVMAAPMNFGEGKNDRGKMHKERVTDDPRYFNFNLFRMAELVVPDLVVIDGFVGMQGEGPLRGDPIESGVAVASTDWLAADRVATEVMGFDFGKIGHYRHCAEASMGEANLEKIRIAGDSIGRCRMPYAPPSSIDKILM